MSRQEYLKLLEREIHALNKRIDQKILRGETYYREARDHKLLLRKVRQNNHSTNIFSKFFPSIFQF